MIGLITGVNGFVGQHLVNELISRNYMIIGCDKSNVSVKNDYYDYFQCDITKYDELEKRFGRYNIDFCIHLAAETYVPDSWKNPLHTIKVNAVGTTNILEYFRKNSIATKILYVSSIEVYGINHNSESKISEKNNHQPESPYAITKSFADKLSLLYAKNYNMTIMSVRPSNHIGPGQRVSFVVPSFISQCLKIKYGEIQPVIFVGNLQSERDFTDVRDIVRAYVEIIEKGNKGESYNVASGRNVSIESILNKIIELTKITPEIIIDSEKYREELKRYSIDTTKIQNEIGWKPRIGINKTLNDTIQQLQTKIN